MRLAVQVAANRLVMFERQRLMHGKLKNIRASQCVAILINDFYVPLRCYCDLERIEQQEND
jgi:hypothetical protein